ncbi:hypothetical protein JJ691_58590 [Kutzneria sp. CA-103260]|nr:hypothetical protein JJ691_58590 [Kutzneria sp. CA-103260]
MMGAYLVGVVVVGVLGALWAQRSPGATDK